MLFPNGIIFIANDGVKFVESARCAHEDGDNGEVVLWHFHIEWFAKCFVVVLFHELLLHPFVGGKIHFIPVACDYGSFTCPCDRLGGGAKQSVRVCLG